MYWRWCLLAGRWALARKSHGGGVCEWAERSVFGPKRAADGDVVETHGGRPGVCEWAQRCVFGLNCVADGEVDRDARWAAWVASAFALVARSEAGVALVYVQLEACRWRRIGSGRGAPWVQGL